jgi:HlyD family secretion protein
VREFIVQNVRRAWGRWLPLLAAGVLGFYGCRGRNAARVQGYAEGEFVYVAAPSGGSLKARFVDRGAQVKAGDPLFSLDPEPEESARAEAERRLAQGQSQLEDAKKGKRAPEIDAIEEQLKQAKASAVLSGKAFARQQELFHSGATAASDFDAARAARDQDQHRVSQLEADRQTALLGSRDDQIAAAAANVLALQASLARAEWNLGQKRQSAPQSGLVFDTLYEPGEWVAAGRPVVSLLPPEKMKVRAFIPEPRIGSIHPGDSARVFVDGVAQPFSGKVSFISPRAEYTPPVIYSQESRGKLVFMLEIRFPPAVAARLHPGQPVDVQIP